MRKPITILLLDLDVALLLTILQRKAEENPNIRHPKAVALFTKVQKASDEQKGRTAVQIRFSAPQAVALMGVLKYEIVRRLDSALMSHEYALAGIVIGFPAGGRASAYRDAFALLGIQMTLGKKLDR